MCAKARIIPARPARVAALRRCALLTPNRTQPRRLVPLWYACAHQSGRQDVWHWFYRSLFSRRRRVGGVGTGLAGVGGRISLSGACGGLSALRALWELKGEGAFMAKLVTGVFKSRVAAEAAVDAIMKRGYTRDDISVLMSDATKSKEFAIETHTHAADGLGYGAAVGGTVGAVMAAIVAVGTNVVLPGLGLVIAGPLAAGLAGAGAGGAAGGLIGALVGAGIPEERVKRYEQGIKQGGILMGVTPRSEEDARYFESRWQEHQGQHVLGTGAGATAGAVTGAGLGAVGGPVGMAAGAAIGAVAGGLAGKGAAEVVNPKRGDDLADHNLAKGVGAGGGAATGAALGAVGGPLGMAAGAAVGAVAGGLAGKGAGEVANPKSRDDLADHHLATGVGA